ncbi:hypothetical protein [Myroides sp. DW712]|uniref:hypothetical protein n=1 Tax=Myroides sp. DW712 TaxID=3389800 RepID=UPI0039786633
MIKNIVLYSVLFFMPAVFAQVGIGIETPEADLDVNVKMRVSNLPNVGGELREYNRVLYADADGNLGYRTRGSAYIYRNSYFSKMDKYSNVRNVLTDLNLSVIVPVLPMKKSLIELSYSMGVMNGASGNASILVGKTPGYGAEEMLHNATRTFSFVNGYSSRATAHGRAISNTYYDEVENNTPYVLFVTYKVYGIVSTNANTKFGMFTHASSTGSNFNWGRGSLSVNVFDYE